MADRLPWFRCFPSALLGALAGLDPDEGLTYVTALLRIYETGGSVAEGGKTLARRTGLTERRAAAALDRLIDAGKLVRAADGRLDSPTTHDEIKWQNDRRGDQSSAGKASAAKRQQQASAGKNGASAPQDNSNGSEKTLQNQQSDGNDRSTGDAQPLNHLEEEPELSGVSPLRAGKRTKRVGKPKTRIEETTQPDEKQCRDAASHGLSGEEFRVQWRRFRDHHLKEASAFADWPAAWRNWLDSPIRKREIAMAVRSIAGGRAPSHQDHFLRLAAEGHHELTGGDDGSDPFHDDVGPLFGAGGQGNGFGGAAPVVRDAGVRQLPPRRDPRSLGPH